MGNCVSEVSGFTEVGESDKSINPPVVRMITEGVFTDSNLWSNGSTPLVKAIGRGRLYLLSISDTPKVMRHVRGFTETHQSYTEFMIGFSHHFHTFIFCWVPSLPGGAATFSTTSYEDRNQTLGSSWQDAVQVTRNGVFSKVAVDNLNNPEEVDGDSRTTVYIRDPTNKRGSQLVRVDHQPRFSLSNSPPFFVPVDHQYRGSLDQQGGYVLAQANHF